MIQTKQPTPKDLEVLSFLQGGSVLSGLQIQKLVGTIDHRDSILRLRKAGHPITSYRVNYTNSEGKHRWYMNYLIIKKAA